MSGFLFSENMRAVFYFIFSGLFYFILFYFLTSCFAICIFVYSVILLLGEAKVATEKMREMFVWSILFFLFLSFCFVFILICLFDEKIAEIV